MLGMAEIVGNEEGVYEGHDPDDIARRLGFIHHFGMDKDSLWRCMLGLFEIEVEYRPWTFRVVRNLEHPYLVLFSHEDDAVHFRLLG
jgi:hypothetical protein